jgi:hypothetical protein
MPADGVRTPTRGAPSADRPRGRQPIPDEVIDAARKNFLRYGVNRTTMADIVDAVLVQRIKEIAEDLTPSGDEGTSFADAFVETSTAAILKARDDHELMNIVATGPMDRVQDVVTGPHPEIHDIVAHLLEPILDRGQQAGLLRTDKSRDEIIDWVRVVFLTLIGQTAIDPHGVRELVGGFLTPSIMFSSDDERRTRSS